MSRRISILVYLGLLALTGLSLVGCVSLADDITPPPGNNRSTDLPATAIPSLQPTEETPATRAPQTAEASGEGVINVLIQDQTGGLLLEDGLDVTLEGYDSFELAYQDTLSAASADQVQFNGVPFPEGRVYFVSVYYGGAIYRSDIVQVTGELTQLDLSVVIFETTTDQAGLMIDRVHILFDFIQPDLAQVAEIYIISNLGPSTIVAESPDGINVEFPLPAEAIDIQFEDGSLGQRYLKTESGFGDTASIPPGSGIYTVSVFYLLPYQNNRLDFNQLFSYPVEAVVLMTPGGGLVARGQSLEDLGEQALPSGVVRVYSGTALARGDSLQFQLSGSPLEQPPVQTAPPPQSSRWVIYGAGGLGVLLLASGVWLYFRNQTEGRTLDEEEQRTDGSREEILDSIIALDDLYAEGDLNEKAYQKKRAQLKDQLNTLPED